MKIDSEISPLKKVLLHKPSHALLHLTPENCQGFLFDDTLWVDKADEEHECFELLLRHNNVEVLLLQELLAQTLVLPEARQWLLDKRLNQLYGHSALRHELQALLHEQQPEILTDYLLGGLTLKESGLKSKSLAALTLLDNDFLLPPLPNHLYARDASCWVGLGVTINSMHFAARRGETHNIAAIYKFHPLFTQHKSHIWFDASVDETLSSLEGGDILVINPETLLIGISQRTSAQAIEVLAKALFAANSKKQIIAVELSKTRSSMHLDTMMTMISQDTFASAFLADKQIRSWTIRPGDKEKCLVVEANTNFYSELAKALEVDKLNIILSNADYFANQREQWTDSANLLTIAPNEVIAYDRNIQMNKKLRAEGINVHEIPGSELSRGRGGPRCMSCPLLRA